MQKAVDHYSEQMAQSLRLPTDMLQELLDEHTACEKEAISVFIEHSFKDENQLFLKLVVICLSLTVRTLPLKTVVLMSLHWP